MKAKQKGKRGAKESERGRSICCKPQQLITEEEEFHCNKCLA